MPYSVEPMAVRDIPEVEAIERQSFSSPWTRRAYEYDLVENPLAHYIVVRCRSDGGTESGEPASQSSSPLPRTWRERLASMVTALAHALGVGASVEGVAAVPNEGPRPPVLGFAGLWMAVQEAHLVTLAVDPAWRRRGLGELLLVSAIDLASALHATSVYLEVRVSNLAAKRLYEKYGFVVSRIRKGYYSDNGEDALEMVADAIDGAQFQARLQRLKKMLVEKLEERAEE